MAQKRSEERNDEARQVSRKDIPRCGSSARCTWRTAPGQSGKMTAIKVVGRLGKLHGGKQRAEDKAQVSQGWLIDGLEKPDRMEVGEDEGEWMEGLICSENRRRSSDSPCSCHGMLRNAIGSHYYKTGLLQCHIGPGSTRGIKVIATQYTRRCGVDTVK